MKTPKTTTILTQIIVDIPISTIRRIDVVVSTLRLLLQLLLSSPSSPSSVLLLHLLLRLQRGLQPELCSKTRFDDVDESAVGGHIDRIRIGSALVATDYVVIALALVVRG